MSICATTRAETVVTVSAARVNMSMAGAPSTGQTSGLLWQVHTRPRLRHLAFEGDERIHGPEPKRRRGPGYRWAGGHAVAARGARGFPRHREHRGGHLGWAAVGDVRPLRPPRQIGRAWCRGRG